MYPSQTSLIPVTVALSRFVENIFNQDGLVGLLRLGSEWYPYWYLGTPFNYLTGPTVPVLVTLLRQLFPIVTLFDITIYLVILSQLLSIVGWYLLATKIFGSKLGRQSLVLVIVFLIFPWRLFYSIALSEASFSFARGLLPYVLLSFWKCYRKTTWTSKIGVVVLLTLLLFVNTSILPILLIGVMSLILASSFRKGRFKGILHKTKLSLMLVLISLLIVTVVWYTPGYWVQILINPSIGGLSGLRVLVRLFDLLKSAVPILLAIISVFFSHKANNKFSVFMNTWGFSFLFLTIFRFIADWDFWQDWTSWFYELEIFITLILSYKVLSFSKEIPTAKLRFGKFSFKYLIYALIIILPFYFTWRVYFELGNSTLLLDHVPSEVSSLESINEISGGERVLLSGTTAFWANAIYDIHQVRGGNDKAAVHPLWNHASYQVREGEDNKATMAWLGSLGVSYVLVHAEESSEYHKDFKNLNKWEDVGELVWNDKGDFIYKLEDSGLVWGVDATKLKEVKRPLDGGDVARVVNYTDSRIAGLVVERKAKEYIIKNPDREGFVVFLETFGSKWKAKSGEGKSLSLKKDSFGHILIESLGSDIIILSY